MYFNPGYSNAQHSPVEHASVSVQPLSLVLAFPLTKGTQSFQSFASQRKQKSKLHLQQQRATTVQL
jgi:hypothetical protein